jgi:hypothetical protein
MKQAHSDPTSAGHASPETVQADAKFSWPKLVQGALLSFAIQLFGWLGSYPIWLLMLSWNYAGPQYGGIGGGPGDWAVLFWLISGVFVYLPTWLFLTLPIYTHLWISRPVLALRSLVFWVLGAALGGTALFIALEQTRRYFH